MSKHTAIRHESELVHEFQQFVAGERDLDWRLNPGSVLTLSIDGRTHCFKPVYSLKPSLPELESLVRTVGKTDPRPILVAPELSRRVLDFCRQHQLNAHDLNGRAYLRAEGLLVDRGALPGRDFRFELEPRNVFVGKSARIIRSLLTDRDRVWGQSELVTRTKASSGLVSRIVNHLLRQGFIEKQSAREILIREPLALLDAWAESDAFTRRNKTVREIRNAVACLGQYFRDEQASAPVRAANFVLGQSVPGEPQDTRFRRRQIQQDMVDAGRLLHRALPV